MDNDNNIIRYRSIKTPDRYSYVRKDYVPEPETPSKYKSYSCDCAMCIKGETCDYCDKPAIFAFIIAMSAIDTDGDMRFRTCGDKEHTKQADKECYKWENGKF